MLSIELVPRALDQLLAQAQAVTEEFSGITWLNIPDIKRLPLRSHDAALAATHLPFRLIPHVRARDRSIGDSVELLLRLEAAGIHDALIITGDRFESDHDAPHPTSLDLLQAAAKELGAMRLWAAFDPYRSQLRAELDYTYAKLEAGAAGIFTQPFFDVRFAEICLEQLDGVETFLGITPVTSERGARYWERENRVVFPPGFEATLDACARLTVDLLQLAKTFGQHAYLMPITVEPLTYLRAVQAYGGKGILADPKLTTNEGAILDG